MGRFSEPPHFGGGGSEANSKGVTTSSIPDAYRIRRASAPDSRIRRSNVQTRGSQIQPRRLP